MGLGTSKAAKTDAVFVDLKFAPNKGEEMVGFRQTISKTPRQGAKEGERKFDYTYQTHNYVDGELAGFRVKEEPSYDDPNVKDLMGYAVIRDVGAEPAPDVVIRFALLSQAGRRMVGLLSAAVSAKAGAIHLYTNFADTGAQIGDKVLDKPQAYLNCKVGDSRGEKLTPLYYGEDGHPLLDADGKPAKLPMGEKHVIARKEVWDFTKADEVVAATAAMLEDAFKRDTNGHEDGHVADEDVDLNEAAGAAMRG
jgi:hypothetical protein